MGWEQAGEAETQTCLGHTYSRCQPGIHQHLHHSLRGPWCPLRWGSLWLLELGCYFRDILKSAVTQMTTVPASVQSVTSTLPLWIPDNQHFVSLTTARWWDLIISLPRFSPFGVKTRFLWNSEYSARQNILFSWCMLLMKRSWNMSPWVSECGKLPAWSQCLCLPSIQLSREIKITWQVTFVDLLIVQ